MARRRTWTKIAGTPARYSHDCIVRDGVTILRVRLAGAADNNPDGVARVSDALDELAADLSPSPDVATLDVTRFCNGLDDACSILTAVLQGVPCCWITGQWDQQRGGQRWDLPPSGRMAPTDDDALARVIEWRRAGAFSLRLSAEYTREWQWTERGLVIRDRHDDKLESEDLYHHNRLVERTRHHDHPVRILWPTSDRTGDIHPALRLGARIELSGDDIVTVDYCPWNTDRPLPDDWLARIAPLTAITTLRLRGTTAAEADILRAVRTLPELRRLELDSRALGPDALAELRRERPDLAVC